MFYNDRLSGKKRKQKIALIVCAVVVLAVWLVLTIRINTIFPFKKNEKCGYGEWINYTPDIADIITADVSISPVSCKMYDRAGILKDYTKEQLGIFSEGKDDADYLVFTVDIKNNGQETVSINRLLLTIHASLYFMLVTNCTLCVSPDSTVLISVFIISRELLSPLNSVQ